MLPIQLLRKRNLELRQDLARRGTAIDWDGFDAQESLRHAAQQRVERLRAQRRTLSEQAGLAKRQGEAFAFAALSGQVEALKLELSQDEARLEGLEQAQRQWALNLPNRPDGGAPDGANEHDNRVVRTVGEVTRATGADHQTVAHAFGSVDTELAAQLSGSRFAVMAGDVARLHRALIQMMLDLHGEHGYREVYVPYLVRGTALMGTGQLPKFEDDLFRTQDDLYLIPTAEVPVTNLVAGRTLKADEVPMAWCAHTPCFRREAGSAGRDTSGILRQHQFEKVELVRVEHPNRSEEALGDIVAAAERVLEALEVPYRVLDLCTGDLGFSAQRTFDLEAWVPSQGTYREISSCSNMGDFQARRMGTLLKDGAQNLTPHTLNGSGLAVGRSLVAVLENHIQPDGRLYVPQRLRAYLGQRAYLEPEALPKREGKPKLG